ncbi:MAG: DUF805 domain-containing protein [Succinivibrionaceae bacterium]|nr:DUF805 domain-containing protein [Succinivibrionaceae bacterium]
MPNPFSFTGRAGRLEYALLKPLLIACIAVPQDYAVHARAVNPLASVAYLTFLALILAVTARRLNQLRWRKRWAMPVVVIPDMPMMTALAEAALQRCLTGNCLVRWGLLDGAELMLCLWLPVFAILLLPRGKGGLPDPRQDGQVGQGGNLGKGPRISLGKTLGKYPEK